MLSEEELKERRRAYNSTPRAKELKKEQKKRYYEKNKEKVNAYKRAYRKRAYVFAKEKEAATLYNKSPKGKECKRKQKEKVRETLPLWYVREKMAQGTRLKSSDIPKELAEAKRVQLLIKREKAKHEKRN